MRLRIERVVVCADLGSGADVMDSCSRNGRGPRMEELRNGFDDDAVGNWECAYGGGRQEE